MKNPRHLFILLGFLAQGMSWESYTFVAVTLGLWMLAVTVLHRKIPFTLSSEAIALLLGCAASVLINQGLQRSLHFFLGDGLILLQVVRLARPLTRREKLTSIVIACFHFGVLCTLAPNIRFVLLFAAAILLFPGALKEAFTDPESWVAATLPPKKRIRLVPTMRVCLWLLLGSGFLFLTAPRFTGTPLQFREGFTDQGSLLDSVLDPRRGGRANSKQVLLQIEGEHIAYLRCFALTEIDGDGVRWYSLPSALREPLVTNGLAKAELLRDPRFLSRKVYIKNSLYLGRIVPVDHSPVFMDQTFFSTPMRNVLNDAIEAKSMWTTANNVYQYFVEKDPAPPPPSSLLTNLTRELSKYPRQSARLTKWLQQTVRNGTNSLHKAHILEKYLRNNFTYQLGAPELDRLAPIDDFILNRQEGHCERFAAAMALFLRMQGVPSRVVIGYVATTGNLFSGRLQVRFCDAHSWAEGYFPDKGWITFDATPGPPPGGGGSGFWDMVEDLDFAWYSHIVNFNGFAQKDLAATSVRLLASVPRAAWNGAACCFLVLLGVAVAVRSGWKVAWEWKRKLARTKHSSSAAARHFYEEMLRVFERKGFPKPDKETPLEFLEELRLGAAPAYNDAVLVTENFCHAFYGQKPLTSEEQAGTEAALKRLKTESLGKNAGNHIPQRN